MSAKGDLIRSYEIMRLMREDAEFESSYSGKHIEKISRERLAESLRGLMLELRAYECALSMKQRREFSEKIHGMIRELR